MRYFLVLGFGYVQGRSVLTHQSWNFASFSSFQFKKDPLSSFGASSASLAITFPGWCALSIFPSAFKVLNRSASSSSMLVKCFAANVSCICVSTTPGRIAIVVMLGSSFSSVSGRWFSTAFEAP